MTSNLTPFCSNVEPLSHSNGLKASHGEGRDHRKCHVGRSLGTLADLKALSMSPWMGGPSAEAPGYNAEHPPADLTFYTLGAPANVQGACVHISKLEQQGCRNLSLKPKGKSWL